jgi:hypothetical protein
MSSSYFHTPLTMPAAAASALAPEPLCPSDAPLLLLPVRLETRFFPAANATVELRIRVYPDKLQIDSHEATLVQTEIEAGQAYWRADWACGDDVDRRKLVWCALADRFGPERAAWIVQALRPTNAPQRPAAATSPGQEATPAPSFPVLPPPGALSWQQAATARLLPERWIACVHASGSVVQVVSGPSIRAPLAVGPNPHAPDLDRIADAAVVGGEEVAVDPGMLWMVDFDEAEAAGMALRVNLPEATAAAGLDSVVVFGVARSLSAAQGSSVVAELLDGHHYTDGLEFLRTGSPTNNTERLRSGHSSRDAGHGRSFAAEVAEGSSAPQAAANAAMLGRVLGLDGPSAQQTLGRLALAHGTHDLDQRCMNTALWQVGFGYFLRNMIGPSAGPTAAHVEWARKHFIHHVRASGMLAPLRVGRQPYGILPVTSVGDWVSEASADDAAMESKLRDLVVALRDQVWRPAAGKAARIGLRPADPDSDLVDVMRMDAVSHRLHTRAAFGRHFIEHLYMLLEQDGLEDLPHHRPEVQQRVRTLLQSLGLPATDERFPRLASMLFEHQAHAVTVPGVQAAASAASAATPLQPNYIAALLGNRQVQRLLAAEPSAQTAVLHALLRHAALREIADAAAAIASGLPGRDLNALLHERDLIDLVDQAPVDFVFGPPARNEHWRRQLQLVVPDVTGAATIEQYLDNLQSHEHPAHPAVRPLGEFYEALEHLQSLPAGALELLQQGTLDLSSYRIDAWITSFANKRLSAMAHAGRGLRIGAYGWVENLRPAPAATAIAPGALPDGEPGPLQALPNDGGFIHAPSLTHATAAALLRNAHLGATGRPQAGDPFAIDLSSRRARKAAQFLQGVQRGQPLGALLGYDFERRLHELELDRFIQPFRALSPQTPLRPGGEGAEQADTHAVVDGLALLRRYEDEADPAVAGVIATGTPSQAEQLTLGFASLRDAVDGVADALTAEAALQLARGNSARLAATLNSVSRGESVPGRLEVLQTPRTGTAVTHRVLCLMSGGPQTAPGWAAASTSPAANGERMLNAWVSRLLRDPRETRVTAMILDTGSGQTTATRTFPLSDLGLTALDFVLGLEARVSQADATSRVERLAEYHAARLAGAEPGTTHIRLWHARPADLGATEVSLADMLEQGRSIRRLLDGARALRVQDLQADAGADAAGAAIIDFADAELRAASAEAALVAARKRLSDQLVPAAAPSCEALRTAIASVGSFGLANSIPATAWGESPAALDTLRAQARALVAECSARLDAGAALRSQPAPADPAARLQRLAERAQAALGPSFLLLPKFTLSAAAAAEFKSALAAGPGSLQADGSAPVTWFARHARVREPVAALAACTRTGEVLGTPERLTLRVAQLPYVAGERWVGLPLLADSELPPDKVSLMIQSTAVPAMAQVLCGIWVDEWVEVTPSATETTAVALQYDPPNATAPQCALMAVPPVPGADWTVESLRRVLVETLDLAKLRAVEPSLLGGVAQYLPASYVALNAAGDAVSTDLAALGNPA